MRNRKKFLAVLLAVSTAVSGIAVPTCNVRADDAAWEADCEPTDPVVETAELPEEDGEYVVYMENNQADEVSLADDAYELSGDNSAEVVLETDLSASQMEQLDELSGQEEIYIEENIFLTGASCMSDENNEMDCDEEEDYEDDDTDASDLALKLALKQMLQEQSAAQEEETEAEWNLQMIHADDVDAEMETTGTPVKVAVLDSGVEFLAGVPVAKSINLVKDEQDLTYYMNDMTGHGTAVADIIHQIAPTAQIYSVRIMDSENRGRLSDVVAGIYWCIEQDVDVINMSFGTSVESEVLRKAIQAAAEHGILMVSSAGNGGTGSAVEYPAAFPKVIAVGAVGTDAQKTEESAAGEEVELAAPGEQILTKSMLGLETVNSGTSMAAPHVAGAAALLMQQSGCTDAAYIRALLDQSSNPLGDEDAYGYGLVDLSYANELLNGSEEITIGEAENEETAGEGAEADAWQLTEQEERPVETFEEVDYVEGRWASSLDKDGTHWDLAGIFYNEENGFTAKEIMIFKTGAVYPDLEKSGLRGGSANPGWHGWNGSRMQNKENYIANFILATRIAKKGGKTADLKKVQGQSDATFKQMKMNISLSCIEGTNSKRANSTEEPVKMKQTWNEIFRRIKVDVNNETDLNYAQQNEKKQKKWRTLFLYGMALHTATDAIAHNSFYRKNGTYHSYVEDKTDDEKNVNLSRWECAQNTAYEVSMDCDMRIEGLITDFSSAGQPCWKRKDFYLGNVIKYAVQVDRESIEEITDAFKAVDYTFDPA